MPGKVKMRCAHCGKTFKSNGRQTLCDDCDAKEHAARAAGKNAASKPATVAAPPQKPLIVGAGARILDPTLPEIPDPAPDPPRHTEPAYPSREQRPTTAVASPPSRAPSPTTAQRKEQPSAKKERPPKAPRPPREPQRPADLSAEQRAAVEARYLELATPVEFDGIRSQIATELGIPKSAVKKAITQLRERMQIPSWWDLQAYKGTEAELERIRAAYLPHLPMPEVGVHKRIGAELGIDQTIVYQAIRRIRAELRLPQYNAREPGEGRVAAPISHATSN